MLNNEELIDKLLDLAFAEDIGDGDTLSLWCTKSDEYDDLYCFNYEGLDYMCDFQGNIVFCSNGEAELWFDEKGNNYYSKSTDIEIWNEFDRSGNIIQFG